MGNLRSVSQAVRHVAQDSGHEVVITSRPEEVRTAERIVLPGQGQGRFGTAANYLLPQFSGVGNSLTLIGDFNMDGAPDVVVGAGPSSALFLKRTSSVRRCSFSALSSHARK